MSLEMDYEWSMKIDMKMEILMRTLLLEFKKMFGKISCLFGTQDCDWAGKTITGIVFDNKHRLTKSKWIKNFAD